jgi:probable phosphoglycerate mutase
MARPSSQDLRGGPAGARDAAGAAPGGALGCRRGGAGDADAAAAATRVWFLLREPGAARDNVTMNEIVVIRHGQTEWSAAGRHTSYTDLDLTPEGERQARSLRPALAARPFAAVWCSPRVRATRTAELAGLTVTEVDEDLVEWNYGAYEGITTASIRETNPGWDLWTDGCPGGESPKQIGARIDQVLDRARSVLADGDVVVIAHGHSLRVLTARWLGLPPSDGALFALETARISALGFEHDRPVLTMWNASPVPLPM